MTKYVATLTTGEQIELKKDCQCLTHDGPHWIHMDELTHRLNQKLLEPPVSYLGLMGFTQEEQARLAEKLHEMTSRKIDSYKKVEAA